MTEPLEVVRTYLDVVAAEADRALLASCDIEARIEGKNTTTNLPLQVHAVGGVRLLVRASQLDEAGAILDSALADDARDASPADTSPNASHLPDTEAGDAAMRRAVGAGLLALLGFTILGSILAIHRLVTNRHPIGSKGRWLRRVAILCVLADVGRVGVFVRMERMGRARQREQELQTAEWMRIAHSDRTPIMVYPAAFRGRMLPDAAVPEPSAVSEPKVDPLDQHDSVAPAKRP